MSVVYNSGSRLHFGRREGDGGSSAVANAVTSVCNNIFLCALAVTLTLSSRIWGHVIESCTSWVPHVANATLDL
jgi:hypothetical protein